MTSAELQTAEINERNSHNSHFLMIGWLELLYSFYFLYCHLN